MCFNRDLADAKFATHLLIQKPADDKGHHLTFTKAQRLVTTPKLLQVCGLNKNRAAALEGLPDRRQQGFVMPWFRQEFDRTSLHGLHRLRNIAVTGNEDDR